MYFTLFLNKDNDDEDDDDDHVCTDDIAPPLPVTKRQTRMS